MTPFGTLPSGETVHRVTLANDHLSLSLLTYGARMQDLRLTGLDRSLVLGSDRLEDFTGPMPYHGALVGPVANRIGTGRVTIEDMTYELERNQDGRMTLHSGSHGMHARNWTVAEASGTHARLTLTLEDGDCDLPGRRDIAADFRLEGATARLEITAETDAPTLMNVANHTLWSMDGRPKWEGHRLRIDAEAYTPADADNLVTGEVRGVEGTDMDFRTLRRPEPGAPMLDHNFCLSETTTDLRDVAELRGASGVAMVLATDRPGLQVFDNHVGLRPGAAPYEGFAMEPQDWPDAPAHRHFPSIGIAPGVPYRQVSAWTFTRGEEA